MRELTFHIVPKKEPSTVRMVLIATSLVFFPDISSAGPCAADIKQIEDEMAQVDTESESANRKSGGVQSSWQPPPRSVARAKMKTDAHYLAAMDRARSLDAEGNAGCMRVVREIKNMIGM